MYGIKVFNLSSIFILFNIKSFIETIQEYDYTLSAWQKRDFLNIVNKETNRLTRLVNDILCISKLDSVKNASLESIDLIETFTQTKLNYQITARDKNLYLHSELLFNNTTVKGNKDLLLQVLTVFQKYQIKLLERGLSY